jgi:hypothetical protein
LIKGEYIVQIKPYFKWFDFWVGLFYDKSKRRLYVGMLPMVGVLIQFKKPLDFKEITGEALRYSAGNRMLRELESEDPSPDGTIHIHPGWVKNARKAYDAVWKEQ